MKVLVERSKKLSQNGEGELKATGTQTDNDLAMSSCLQGVGSSESSHRYSGIWNRGPFIKLVTVEVVQSISGPSENSMLGNISQKYATWLDHERKKPLARNLSP